MLEGCVNKIMSRFERMIDPGAWGVQSGYEDVHHVWHDAPAETIDAVLQVMGAEEGMRTSGPPGTDSIVLTVGESVGHLEGDWVLTLETGEVIKGREALPHDLPLGYHNLERLGVDFRHGTERGSSNARLIVAPPSCWLPTELHEWGWALQLYALRSEASWGIGDFGDLRRFATFASRQGAGMLLLNPLHAALPGLPQQPSPYYPSSRVFRNPLYLSIEDAAAFISSGLPAWGQADSLGLQQGSCSHCGWPETNLEALAKQGHALALDRRIDRDEVWRLKLEALEHLWLLFGGDTDFDRFRLEMDPFLHGYATFCALSEVHGRPWWKWPGELRHPSSPWVDRFATEHAERIRFHEWLQWLLDRQLELASQQIPLVHDLAIGVDPAGADAWLWQDCLALDVRVGAPPDQFNTQGQDWRLPPFDPWRLRRAGFEPFVRTVRAGLRHAGGLRFDHVMGLFRLFWIPPGASPATGTYVSYPWRELLAILALESTRAGAYVVGEDLGTVEERVRRELGQRNLLSYRLLWFEKEPPPQFPARTLAAVTTHDLPTIAGLWTGIDLEIQERLGLQPNKEATRMTRDRLKRWIGVDDDADVHTVTTCCHDLLAQAPSALVTATIDDALGISERPNFPGTIDEWPNWSLALPKSLEEIEHDPRVEETAQALHQGRQRCTPSRSSKDDGSG